MNSKTRSTFEKACSDSFTRRIVGTPDIHTINRCLERGDPIPENLLPGRFIMRMSEQDRQALASLTSNDTASYRPNFWASCT